MAEMDPADVPAELVRAALKTWCVQCSLTVGRQPVSDHEEDARAILAAVLPRHAQLVRAGIVEELQAHAADCCATAERSGQRFGRLMDEAQYFAAAARLIASDEDGGEDA